MALQGGGAHGAFTWGVLDRFLDEDDIEIAGISGTSAGALNGAAFKAGMLSGGRDGARENLNWLWHKVGAINDMRMASWMTALMPSLGQISQSIEYSLPFSFIDSATRMFSPYTYGPFYQNPLERIVAQFSYDKVCAHDGPALFVCATNVRTGKIKIFEGEDISTNAILASTCLPTIFQAVEIHDPATDRLEAYWDGGYTGNPALFPLFTAALPDDIVIVNINPLERQDIPKTAPEIQNRINEISFNSSLLRELRAINFVKRLLHDGALKSGTMEDIVVHMIADDDLMNMLSVATKMVPSPYVLSELKQAGQRAAERFIAAHKDQLNVESTIDLPAMFN
nr:patatin-like phospholipase family protein [Sulfitobacter algicola]